MSLKTYLDAGWLRPHKTTPKEIQAQLLIVDRELKDAAIEELTFDNQYGIAYNAALRLCTILLFAEGYTLGKGQGGHIKPINALPLILGEDMRSDSDYLDGCRQMRNRLDYESIGAASKEDADELIRFCHELRTKVLVWLKGSHPGLLPPG